MTKVRMILLGGFLVLLALAGCRSAHTTSAILYIEEQQYDKAIAVLQEGFEYRDDEPDAFYYLGEAYSRKAEDAVNDNNFTQAKKNYELAYQNYSRAVELDSVKFADDVRDALLHNYSMRLRRGVEDFNGGYYEQAEGHFRLAYATLPDSLTPIKNIARMKMKQASEVADPEPLYEQSLDLIDKVLAVNPEAYALQANKAEVLVKLNRVAEADSLYSRLLREHGDDPYLLIDIVNLSVTQKQFERAADLTLRIIDIYQGDEDPSNDGEQTRELLVNAATWLARDDIRRYDESLELLDQALDLETVPTQETLFQRLQTYYQYGIWLKEQAETEADLGVQTALNQKSRDQFRLGVDVGNALVAQFPDNCAGYLTLAQCQFEAGDNQAADLNINKWQECQGGAGGGTDNIQ